MFGETTELEVTFMHQTDNAVLVEYEGEEFWIPGSQIHEDSEIYPGCDFDKGDDGTLICSEWIAKQKNIL